MKSMSILVCLTLALLLQTTVSVAAGEIWIQWNPNSEPDLQHYIVYKSSEAKAQPDRETEQFAITKGTQILDNSVEPGETYYYWVASEDLYGNLSIASGPVIVTVDENIAEGPSDGKTLAFLIQHVDEDQDPLDPYIDKSRDNDNNVEFTWSVPDQDNLTFKIYLAIDAGEDEFITEVNENFYAVSNAEPGSYYRLRVDIMDAEQQLFSRGYSDLILCEELDETVGIPTTPKVEGYE